MTAGAGVRRYWTETTRATVDAAIGRVASGHPSVLLIEGEAGMGKSTLCAEVVERAARFAVFPAEGVAGQDAPYGVLDQWGVHVPRTAQHEQIQPFVAAQVLRQLTDAATGVAAHVLLLVDDVQWADVESMEALVWLLRRAAGDHLLVVLATRPAPERRRESWRRWLDTSDAVLQVGLDGLSYDDARALVADHSPAVSTEVAEQLWLHTRGNPLYLTNLLVEHEPADLGELRTVPAPAEYAAQIADLLHRQPADAVRLAEALSVLGAGRTRLRDAGAVAGLEHVDVAAQRLLAAGLVLAEGVGAAADLRWVHGLAGSAVYHHLSPPRRQELHTRSAQVLTSPAAVFEHRLAAAEQQDEPLARDLERAAGGLYDQHSYRQAAQYLRSAADLTADRAERLRRWLDAAFCSVLAHSAADLDLTAIDQVSDPVRRGLVLGALACFSGRYREGAAILSSAANTPVDRADPLPRHRLEMLLAWVRTLLGHDLELITTALDRGLGLDVTDPAMTPYRLLAQGHVAGRTGGWVAFAAVLDRLPEVASATPPELSGLLVWRGQDHLAKGLLGAATADLREVQRRQHDGVVDALSNGFDSLLATTYWAAGRWELAKVAFRSARMVPAELTGLLTYAASSLPWSTSGDFGEADRQLDDGARALEDRPWQEAVEVFLGAQVVRRHAGGSAAAQATLLAETRQRWPHTPVGTGLLGGIWAIHLALAGVWAGELDWAERQLARATAEPAHSPSVRSAASWVSGLLAEQRGRTAEALRHLRTSVSTPGVETPLYQAHAFADHARLARLTGAQAEAARSTEQALGIYRNLQAKPYLARLADAVAPTLGPAKAPEDVYVLPLTEREYDVLTLVVEGYSYAQISRELFVSQSTVSYHLGNIYPKAGVRSRHELTRWVRQHPGSVVAPGAERA